jgi:DNA-binding CsgD family transcriptional regulator
MAAHGSDPALATAVFASRVSLLMSIGDPAAWDAVSRLAEHDRSVAQRQQMARGYCNIADATVWLGHYRPGSRFIREGLRLAVEAGASYMTSLGQATALRLDWALGRWGDLAERAAQFVEAAQDMPLVAADGRLVLAGLALARGEWRETAAHLDDPVLLNLDDACGPHLAAAAALRARIQLALGHPAAAYGLVAGALDHIRGKGIWVWSGEPVAAAVAALARAGRLAEASALVAELDAGISGRDAPYAAAALAGCRAVLAEAEGRFRAAAELFGAAEARYAELPHAYEAARATEGSARCRAAAGEPAESLLLVAAERYSVLGATWDAARCQSLLRGRGSGLPQRRGRRGYGEQLSPREREVARLLVLGRTNREMAEVLYLSPRTVEQHVSSVLRKVGAGSRASLTSAHLH